MTRYGRLFWLVSVVALTIVAAFPFLSLISGWQTPNPDLWDHIKENLLQTATYNSFFVVCCSTVLALFFGLGCAWILERELPQFAWLKVLMIAPLCLPKYALALAYLDIFQFIERSLGLDLSQPSTKLMLLALILALAEFPYIYLTATAGLQSEDRSTIEAAKVFGAPRWTIFLELTLPHLRPFLIAGASLVALSAYGDFAATAVFGVDTLSTLIYKIWTSYFSLAVASQIASLALIPLVLFFIVESLWSSQDVSNSGKTANLPRMGSSYGFANILITIPFALLFFGAMLPFLHLFQLALSATDTVPFSDFVVPAQTSILLAISVAVLCVVISLVVSALVSQQSHFMTEILQGVLRLGYGVPGTILAICVIATALVVDQTLGSDSGMLANGFWLCIAGLSLRFFAVSLAVVRSAFARIPLRLVEAAKVEGATTLQTIYHLYVPTLLFPIAAALVMVTIDALKEVPITLMTRPYGWDSLAVKVFEYTSEGEWAFAAVPAVILCTLGLAQGFLLPKDT